jgi:deoxyribodipyrimidine photolyase-like uncharacterized protein
MVARRFPDGFGSLDDFRFAVTREQALASLAHFVETALPGFGDDQDGMLQASYWRYHMIGPSSYAFDYADVAVPRAVEVLDGVWRDADARHAAATRPFLRQRRRVRCARCAPWCRRRELRRRRRRRRRRARAAGADTP